MPDLRQGLKAAQRTSGCLSCVAIEQARDGLGRLEPAQLVMATVRMKGRLSGSSTINGSIAGGPLRPSDLAASSQMSQCGSFWTVCSRNGNDLRVVQPGDGLQGLQADLGFAFVLPDGLMLLVAALQLGERARQDLAGCGQAGRSGFGDAVQGLAGAEEQPAAGDRRALPGNAPWS